MKKILLLILAMLLLLGCASDLQPKAQEPQRGVKICTSMSRSMTLALVEDFAEKTGIAVEIVSLPPGATAMRLAYLADIQADVWLGGSAEEFWLAGEQGLLQSYRPREANKIPPELRQNNWLWTALYVDHIAFLSHRDNLHALGLYAPTSWEDLLNSAFYQEVVLAHPQNGGAPYGMITTLWQLWGARRAMLYAEAWHAQKPLYTNSNSVAIEEVFSGRKTVAIVPLSYALLLEQKEPGVFASIPQDGNKNMVSGAALLKGNNTDEGKAFISYLLSERAAEVLGKEGLPLLWSISKEGTMQKEIVGDLHTAIDDLSWTAEMKAEIIQQWQEYQ